MDKSRKIRLISSGVLLLLLICAAAVQWERSRQPVWQGKTVGEWFVEFRKARPRHRHSMTVYVPSPLGTTNIVAHVAFSENVDDLLLDPAAKALNALGTKAVPFLEAEVLRGESLWARGYRSLLQKIPVVFGAHFPAAPRRRDAIRGDAALALAALGTNGAGAVPAILEAYGDRACFARWDCRESLSRLPRQPEIFDAMLVKLHGSNLIDPVTAIIELQICTSTSARILTNALFKGNVVALLQLHYYRAQAKVVLPALSLALKSPNREIQEGAARVLRTFGPDGAGAFPALAEALKTGHDELRYQSACALEEMGANALPAADALSQATNDPSLMVQTVVTRALRKLRGGSGSM